MVIQGSNLPVVVKFSHDVSDIAEVEIHMYTPDGAVLKHWSKSDVNIRGSIIEAPLTQEETMDFPEGTFVLEVKWLDADGLTHFTHRIRDKVMEREDKTVMGEEDVGDEEDAG